jgi:hypothetical protein
MRKQSSVTRNIELCEDKESNTVTNEEFNVHGSVIRNNMVIYIQQDATLHSLFHLETALHVSGGTITHHQERS